MASVISHAVAALSIGTGFHTPTMARRVWIAGALCSMIPDVDVIGFHFGVHYSDFWGHRGFTHSLLFAAVLAVVVAMILLSNSGIARWPLFAYLFIATASHGVLDAMTNGGLGIAFFSPFNNERCFLPWRPIRVSPIAASRFFSARGLAILQNEFVWIWIPAIAFAAAVLAIKWSRRRRAIS
jgi:inner membrane protein